jgi:hypothetical protein
MQLEEHDQLTHWLGNVLLRHFGQEGDLTFREASGPPIFIKLHVGGRQIKTTHLRAVVFHNPFEAVESPPLCCLFLEAPINIYRAVLTRSPELITRVVDEMIQNLRDQCVKSDDSETTESITSVNRDLKD